MAIKSQLHLERVLYERLQSQKLGHTDFESVALYLLIKSVFWTIRALTNMTSLLKQDPGFTRMAETLEHSFTGVIYLAPTLTPSGRTRWMTSSTSLSTCKNESCNVIYVAEDCPIQTWIKFHLSCYSSTLWELSIFLWVLNMKIIWIVTELIASF